MMDVDGDADWALHRSFLPSAVISLETAADSASPLHMEEDEEPQHDEKEDIRVIQERCATLESENARLRSANAKLVRECLPKNKKAST